jgi:hypothetical protein
MVGKWGVLLVKISVYIQVSPEKLVTFLTALAVGFPGNDLRGVLATTAITISSRAGGTHTPSNVAIIYYIFGTVIFFWVTRVLYLGKTVTRHGVGLQSS